MTGSTNSPNIATKRFTVVSPWSYGPVLPEPGPSVPRVAQASAEGDRCRSFAPRANPAIVGISTSARVPARPSPDESSPPRRAPTAVSPSSLSSSDVSAGGTVSAGADVAVTGGAGEPASCPPAGGANVGGVVLVVDGGAFPAV